MALLHLLHGVSVQHGIELRAGHFDHGARRGSEREAVQVRGWVERLGIPCRIGRANGLPHNQAAFRDARYAWLDESARQLAADRIALAHHADDQIETILFRLARGTGLRGMGGIPLRRGRYVRPLLPLRRAALDDFVRAHGIRSLADPSNADRRFARARVRHDLWPMLSAGGGTLARQLFELGVSARQADGGLERRAERICDRLGLGVEGGPGSGLAGTREDETGLQIARSKLVTYDRAEQARVLRLLARRLGYSLTRGGTRLGVEFIKRGRSGGAVQIADRLELRRDFDRLLMRPPPRTEADDDLTIDAAGGCGTVTLGGREYAVAWGCEAESADWVARLPLDSLRFPLRLRGPRPGDRIRTRAGSRKLKKLFNEHRVPRSRRATVPVLVAADGRVSWVAGLSQARMDDAQLGEESFVIGVSDLRDA
jgi:tRNA(Ile)-lysidine synthase